MSRGHVSTDADFLPPAIRATSGGGIPGRTNTTVTDAEEQINQLIEALSSKEYLKDANLVRGRVTALEQADVEFNRVLAELAERLNKSVDETAAIVADVTDSYQLTVTELREVLDRLDVIEDEVENSPGTDAVLSADLQVMGVTVGALTDGATLAAGTTLEAVFRSMLTQRIAAVYAVPVLSLTATGAAAAEIGTTTTITLTPAWSQNDGGERVTYSLQRGGVEVSDAFAAFTTSITYAASTISFQARADYAAGAIKNDNLGDPSPAGAILAGTTTSAARTYTGYRRAFFGMASTYATSADIRALSGSKSSPSAGSTLVSTNITGTELVWAYPATLRDFTSVSMVSSGFTFDISSEIEALAQVQVADASGAGETAYKLYRYKPAAAFTSATFTFTI